MENHLFCFGFGYVAQRLAPRLLADGWQVSGSTRSAEKARHLATAFPGVTLRVLNEATSLSAQALQGVTHGLVSLPPDAQGDPVARHMDDGFRPRWLGYFSTVGVYGDAQGAWVDEDTPPNPTQLRAGWRVLGERDWLDWGQRTDAQVQIFRLPGIYGPGRSVFDQLRDGSARKIVRPGHVFSRVHVDDIAGAVLSAQAFPKGEPEGKTIFNVCDDEPSDVASVLDYACGLLGRPPLNEEAFDVARTSLSPMALSFWHDRRRVSNTRLKTVLGYRLVYPTFRDGLKGILAEEKGTS